MAWSSGVVTLAAMLLCASCFPVDPLSNGVIRGTVILSTPVKGATVTAWWLDADGEIRSILAQDVITDDQGGFEFDIGPTHGTVLIEATGGTTQEWWSEDKFKVTMPMRVVLLDFRLDEVRLVTVSPLTTLATELGERHLHEDRFPGRHVDTMLEVYTLMSEHFSVDITAEPVDVGEPAEIYHRALAGLMLTGLSALAKQIAEESGYTSVHAYNTMHLTQALLADISDTYMLFDGVGPGGEALIEGSCDTVCNLSANTLRADLAGALLYQFFLTPANGTGLEVAEVLPALEHLRDNMEPVLFGDAPISRLSGQVLIDVMPTEMDDESQDIVTFTADSEPVHQRSGAPVTLGMGDDCVVVYKHVTRMDDPEDNPLRWQFTATSPGLEIERGEYRVRLQGGDWLTEWRPAELLGSGADSAAYQVTLLRAELPELATVRGLFDIEFRAADRLAQQATVRRCWEHVPLAAPADIRPAREVTGPESLHAWGLEQGKQLAPLLNGVPLDQGAGIMEFEIRNGTDEPIYITLNYDQPVVTYTKDWIETSGLVRTGDSLPYACWNTGACALSWPSDRRTTDPAAMPGFVMNFIGGLRIWDLTTNPAQELESCEGCDINEYRLEPRYDPHEPRIYRVMLIVNELEELAPDRPGDPLLAYQDVALHDVYAPDKIVTGIRYPTLDVPYCAVPLVTCTNLWHYAYYRALQEVSVSASLVQATARTSPLPALPPRLFASGADLRLEGYVWRTVEQLPEPYPTP